MPDFTLQYVYQLSDFDTSGGNESVPNEGGARAAGTPPFQLQLDAGASPLQVDVTDPNSTFGEIQNTGQVLTDPITIDGVLYPAGTSILLNYVITTDSGFEGYSITLGANNTGNNTTTAFITNAPMVPGQTYVFTSEGNVGNTGRPYAQFACFAAGTMIATCKGLQPVEDLAAGDMLTTGDGDTRPLKIIMRRRLSDADLQAAPNLRPIRIVAGALGRGLPRRDLLVSPQHRILVSSPITQRMFGAPEVLVAAKKLTDLPGIFVDEDVQGVEYFHLVMDQHDIIIAEGAPTESFYCGATAISGLSLPQKAELFALFPELAERRGTVTAARPIPEGRLQKKLAERHLKNAKELISG